MKLSEEIKEKHRYWNKCEKYVISNILLNLIPKAEQLESDIDKLKDEKRELREALKKCSICCKLSGDCINPLLEKIKE